METHKVINVYSWLVLKCSFKENAIGTTDNNIEAISVNISNNQRCCDCTITSIDRLQGVNKNTRSMLEGSSKKNTVPVTNIGCNYWSIYWINNQLSNYNTITSIYRFQNISVNAWLSLIRTSSEISFSFTNILCYNKVESRMYI